MATKVPGIYVIADLTEARTYVGSSVDMGRRLYTHHRKLETNTHPNYKLQRAHNRGHDLRCIPIPTDGETPVTELEQTLLDEFFPQQTLLNIAPDATAPTLGRTFGPETRLKVSQAGLGRRHTEEAKEKIRQGHLGKTKNLTEEGRASLAQATSDRFKGKSLTDDHKQKLSDRFKGRPLSPEHYQKNLEKSKEEQKPVVCAGKAYPGIREACRELNIPRSTLMYRVDNPKNKSWYRLTDEPTLEKGSEHE